MQAHSGEQSEPHSLRIKNNRKSRHARFIVLECLLFLFGGYKSEFEILRIAEDSKEKLERYTEKALEKIKELNKETDFFAELAIFFKEREN